jgi:biopolymer transport protein ExbD
MPKRRNHEVDAELNITSLMDIMTIILVFLLKSYSTEDIQIAPSENLLLPVSSSEKPPELAVNAVISKVAITVDGVDVVMVSGNQVGEQDKRGTLITPLFDALKAAADQAKANAATTNSKFNGRLLLQCDREIPFSLVREVMYTAGQAQFAEFKFVVYQGGGG